MLNLDRWEDLPLCEVLRGLWGRRASLEDIPAWSKHRHAKHQVMWGRGRRPQCDHKALEIRKMFEMMEERRERKESWRFVSSKLRNVRCIILETVRSCWKNLRKDRIWLDLAGQVGISGSNVEGEMVWVSVTGGSGTRWEEAEKNPSWKQGELELGGEEGKVVLNKSCWISLGEQRKVTVGISQGYRPHGKAFKKLYLLKIKHNTISMVTEHSLARGDPYPCTCCFTWNTLLLPTLERFDRRDGSSISRSNLNNVWLPSGKCRYLAKSGSTKHELF